MGELVQQVLVVTEQLCHLLVHLLDRALLLLVGLQDVKKRLVLVISGGESRLDLVDVHHCLVKLNGLACTARGAAATSAAGCHTTRNRRH